jgi:hypothetical protein
VTSTLGFTISIVGFRKAEPKAANQAGSTGACNPPVFRQRIAFVKNTGPPPSSVGDGDAIGMPTVLSRYRSISFVGLRAASCPLLLTK